MPLEAVYQLLFEPQRTKAYLSYPMQHVSADAERGLAAFKARLSEYLIVFDPGDVNDAVDEDAPPTAQRSDGSATIEALQDSETLSGRRDPLQQHIADQIVERDYKLIAQSEVVVVYYDVPVPSPGVISEMKFALESGKRVYGVWLPGNEPSVFFTRYCSQWFRTPEGVLEQLRADLASGAQPQPRAAGAAGP
jgi:adenylate kinase